MLMVIAECFECDNNDSRTTIKLVHINKYDFKYDIEEGISHNQIVVFSAMILSVMPITTSVYTFRTSGLWIKKCIRLITLNFECI